MKKGKKICVLLSLLSVVSVLCAAEVTMDDVCDKLAKHPITKGDFVQTKTINATKRSLKSTGEFIFSLDGIMWKTLKPFPSSMIVTTKSVIQVAADGSKTVIDVSDNQVFGSIATTLVAVFSNDVNQLKANFNTTFKDKGNDSWELILDPKDSTIASVMQSLTLGGRNYATEASIDYIVMTEASGNTIKYEFINQTYPEELTQDEKNNFGS
jgi:outer membrane lipoprotein-sorting protein